MLILFSDQHVCTVTVEYQMKNNNDIGLKNTLNYSLGE